MRRIKIIEVSSELKDDFPYKNSFVIPALYSQPKIRANSYLGVVHEIDLPQQGRVAFTFDPEVEKIVKVLTDEAENTGRARMLREVHRLENLEFGSRSLATAVIKVIDDYNAKPWYERVWIALFDRL